MNVELRNFRIKDASIELIRDELWATILVPDVTDPAKVVEVRQVTRLMIDPRTGQLDLMGMPLGHIVERMLRELLHHEILECLYVDGKQWRDPHENDKFPGGGL